MRLIEKHCTLDALYPDRIEITAPMVAVGATEMSDYTLIFKDHAAWKASGLKFLEDSAPESVISGLALSRLNRMRVERPAEFSEWVRKQAAVGLPKSPTGMTEDGELAAFGKPEG